MRPCRRAVLAAVALVSGALILVGGLRVLPAVRERSAARAFATLAMCLAGPERAAPEEAAVRARRIHLHGRAASLTRCRETADTVAQSRAVRAVAPALAAEADITARAIEHGDLPENLVALWRAAEGLRWMPEPGAAATYEHAPAPLLDTQIPELRRALPGLQFLRDQDDRRGADNHPLDRAILGFGQQALSVKAGPNGEPLAVPVWENAPRATRWYVRVTDGVVTVHAGAVRHLVLGPGTMPMALGDRVVWMLDGKLKARRLDTDDVTTALRDVPTGKEDVRYRSCRTHAGDVLAVETDDTVHVLLLRDGGADLWGQVPMAHPEPPAHAGALGLTCDDAGARLSWALSEPSGPAHIAMNGHVTLPEGSGRHRIITVACDPHGCTRREATTESVDIGWSSVGGWSSAVYLATPDVIDLGAHLLIVWPALGSIHYQLAALDALDRMPPRWLAATSRPQDRDPLDPRAIAWPRWQIHPRGDVALVVVQEWAKDNASFLVRFDGAGHADVLTPPPRP
ncbi:Hypothetical protein A7982_11199 [Minicystis rosea]|nr:Hypothetical protein A7982_11199 [Minicystis rosea]